MTRIARRGPRDGRSPRTIRLGLTRFLGAVALTVSVAGAAGCGSDSGPSAPGGGPGYTPPPSGDRLPSELVGAWITGDVSSVNFFSPSTGHWSNGYGEGMYFRFTANGTYEQGFLMHGSLYSCSSDFFGFKSGTVRVVDDSTLALHPTYGRVKSTDSCVEANNYERADNALEDATLIWRFGPDDYGYMKLWLRYPDSGASPFRPES
jgi:hypothetical protein